MLNAVKIINGKAVTTSRKVAEVFEKQHKDVLRVIRELEIPEEFGRRNFTPVEYEAINNLGKTVKYPEYLITRDGFTILAMGFTGKKAMQFKIAYINAFNAMEEQLKSHCCCAEPKKTPNVVESSVAVIEMINQQLLAGVEVDKEVLRYAWNIGRLMGKAMRREVAGNSDIEAFINGYETGVYSRGEIYRAYCKSCSQPMSARYFWPCVRNIRHCRDIRKTNARYVVFE